MPDLGEFEPMIECKIDFTRFASAGLPSTYHEPDTTIFHEGSLGGEMYVVQSGRIELMCGGNVVCVAEAGDIFGEMALIDGSQRSASARTPTGCTLAAINEQAFLFMVKQQPFFALEVMRVMAARLREMNTR